MTNRYKLCTQLKSNRLILYVKRGRERCLLTCVAQEGNAQPALLPLFYYLLSLSSPQWMKRRSSLSCSSFCVLRVWKCGWKRFEVWSRRTSSSWHKAHLPEEELMIRHISTDQEGAHPALPRLCSEIRQNSCFKPLISLQVEYFSYLECGVKACERGAFKCRSKLLCQGHESKIKSGIILVVVKQIHRSFTSVTVQVQ